MNPRIKSLTAVLVNAALLSQSAGNAWAAVISPPAASVKAPLGVPALGATGPIVQRQIPQPGVMALQVAPVASPAVATIPNTLQQMGVLAVAAAADAPGSVEAAQGVASGFDGDLAAPAAANDAPPSEIVLPDVAESKMAGLSQAQRLSLILGRMKPTQRKALYAELSVNRKSLIDRAIRGRDQAALSPGVRGILERQPGMSFFLKDLLSFGGTFPAIFKLPNADQTIMLVLDALEKKEKTKALGNPDILRAGGLTYRLSRTIDDGIANFITQANAEYGPMKFKRTSWQKFWYGVKMWFLPLHNRVEHLVDGAQFFQKQLERYRDVDSLIVRTALADAIPLKLTNDEVHRLAAAVLAAPSEVGGIEKNVRAIYHRKLKAGSLVAVGDFDLYAMYRKVRNFDFEASIRGYDDSNLEQLNLLDGVLNDAAVRLGRPPRTLKDNDLQALRLYFEAYERGVERYSEDYFSATSADSNESYTVERRHTRQVYTGRDSKGNAQYRTEVYYTDSTVTPTFEDMLADDYDTGDRFVSGLDEVKEAAAAMVAAESPYRSLIDDVQARVQAVVEGHDAQKSPDAARTDLQAALGEVETAIQTYTPYASSSARDIRRRYANDDVENFKARNSFMLKRLTNMKSHIAVLDELLRRGEPDLRPSFDIYDFGRWLVTLRSYRNWNYAVKSVMVAAAAGGIAAYAYLPEVAFFVDRMLAKLI